MEEETQEQTKNRPWLWKKGQSGNPGGRKKGSKSMKQWAKEMLESMNEDQRQDFIDGLPKNVIWEMAEGKAVSKLEGDINIKVDKLSKLQRATEKILKK